MKILYLSPNGYLGGAERCVCNIMKGHADNHNLETSVIFFYEGDASNLCKKMGVDVHILPIKFKMRNILQVIKVCLYIRRFVKKNQYDILHSTMPYAHIIAFFSSLYLNIKRVWFQHGPVGGPLDRIANLLHVDRIYFNSKYLEEEHLKMKFSKRNIPKHKMINYGILDESANEENVSLIKKEYKVNQNSLFLSAGRLCPWKGQLELIKAIILMRKKDPRILEKIKFLIIGSYGRIEDKVYEDQIKSEIKKAMLEEHVIMLGHKNNIVDYYHSCDVFLHTSNIAEPFGLVVAESMKNHCLVIGSDHGGVTDILKNEITGYSYKSTGKNAQIPLAEVIQNVILELNTEKEKVAQIKENAAQLIHDSYSVSQMTEALENDYSFLLNR